MCRRHNEPVRQLPKAHRQAQAMPKGMKPGPRSSSETSLTYSCSSWAAQSQRLSQARELHPAARTVAVHRIERHPAVVAVGEEELQLAPVIERDLCGVEVRNPSAAGGQLDTVDRRRVAGVVADAGEPRLLGAVRCEREPRREEPA